MAMPRESSFMPTITCSSCGNPVQISMMGEHVCTGPPDEPSPPLENSYGGFGGAFQVEKPPPVPALPSAPSEKYGRLPTNQTYGGFGGSLYDDQQPPAPSEKYGRLPPPVNTDAANRPYMRNGELTPGSHSGDSRGVSPLTPNDRFAPASGLDEPLSARYPLDPPLTPRRPGGYGGFAEQMGLHTPQSDEKPAFPERADSSTPVLYDTGRRPSAARNAFPKRKESLAGNLDLPTDLLRDSHPDASSARAGAMAPPRAPRQHGYGGFGAPSPDGASEGHPAMNRSETFPKPSHPMDAPFRTPSAPGSRPDKLARNNTFDVGRRPSMGPDTSRPPPPRRSIVQPRTSGKAGSVDLAAEFGVGNPYHTPSDSASSGYSTFSSHVSQSSTHTSPARSQPVRKPSDHGRFDDVMTDLSSSMNNLSTSSGALSTTPTEPQRQLSQSPIHDSLLSTSPGTISGLTPSPRSPRQPQPDSYFGLNGLSRQRNDSLPGQYGATPPSPRTAPPSRKGSRDPGSAPYRGDCKACGTAIVGKSISSADGRLTGKYHKPCFVCTTCSQPFTSAEFYVLNDKPYCEQHYHKLNGSLCGSCLCGIEGQYLEDESRTKYHVGCFRCLDCGRSLSDGYFEVDGMSYCEPDAWKRLQQYEAAPPSPAFPPSQMFPPRGGPGGSRPPVNGLPARPGPPGRAGLPMGRPPYGKPPPGSRLGPGPMRGPRPPQMNKRMTRLGNM